MTIVAFGLNHHTAPVAVREQVAIAPEHMPSALGEIMDHGSVSETVILSTCNRTEVYCQLQSGQPPLDWFTKREGPGASGIRDYLFDYREAAAVKQLLRVAASLDSMVVGEPQILGQLKAAYRAAQQAGTVGPVLNRLLQHSFAVAKQIRRSTSIGRHPVSVAFAAVRLAEQIFADLSRRTALLIGAGETIELAARHLVENGIGQLIVANRSFDRSRRLAEQFGAFAATIDTLPGHLSDVDIILSATSAPGPVLTAATMLEALRSRKRRPVLLLDIAVPRDIEPAIGDHPDAYLYTVDDLQEIIDDNRYSRRAAAEEAEEIVAEQVEAFLRWQQSLDALPAILALRERARTERDVLVARARRQLKRGDDPDEVLGRLADALINRLTHRPSVALREAATEQDTELLEAARKLLDLDRR